MYAFVKFISDGVNYVVSVKDIKNFDWNLYETDPYTVFEVFWKSSTKAGTGFYHAIVLLIEETKELINERKKRVRMPSDQKWEELKEKISELAEKKKNNKDKDNETREKNKDVQVKRTVMEKEQLKKHIKKRMEMKLNKESMSENSDDGDLSSKSEINYIKEENKRVIQKLKLKEQENIMLKKKIEKLQKLNMRLQENMWSLIDNGDLRKKSNEKEIVGSCLDSTESVNKEAESVNKEKGELRLNSAAGGKEMPVKSCLNSSPLSCLDSTPLNIEDGELRINSVSYGGKKPVKSCLSSSPLEECSDLDKDSTKNTEQLYLHYHEGMMEWNDGKIELAPGVTITSHQWVNVTRGKNINASKFTRNLAVSLWGSEDLRDRSVTGVPCRRFKKEGIEAKRALTPIKVDAVKNGLTYFLRSEKGLGEAEIRKLSSLVAVRKMIGDKIMDLNKQSKKVAKED